jgi:hypothetical protein
VALRRPEAEDVEVELEVLVVYEAEVPCEAEEDAALERRSTDSDLERSRWAGDWRKRGSFEVAVGDVGGLANVGEAGVGGWSVSGVVVVAGGVGVARGTGPWELWRLDMRIGARRTRHPDPAESKIVSDATPDG